MSARWRPTRSTNWPTTRISPNIPTMCTLMTVKTFGLLVVVPDDDVAAQVHHARHDRQARDGGDGGRRNSGPPKDLAERRGGFRRRRNSWREALAFELQRDRARVRADSEREDEPHDAHRRSGEPRDDEGVELEVLPGEQRPEHQRPERGTEQRAEEDVRDRPRLRDSGYMSATAVPREQHGAVHPTHTEKAEDDERRGVHHAAERGQQAADSADDEPAREDGNAPVAVHEPAGRQGGECPGGRNIAGPRPSADSIPVTRTSVIVATAAGELQYAGESVTRHSARSTVFRRIGRALVAWRAMDPLR